MDRILVVCYSYTGTSRQLAQLLCAQLGWPMGEIVEARQRAGPTGTLRCVADSLLRRRPLIRYDGPDPGEFETVVLVSPIWIYRLAGPMRSFVADRVADLRRVAVVSVMGAQGASNAVAEIGRLLGHAPMAATSFTSREVDDGSCADRLQGFGRALQAIRPDVAQVSADSGSPRAA